MDDELENLREKSTRASAVYDDFGETGRQGRSRGTTRGLSPVQRLILAFLLFLDILALAVAILIISGQISF